MTQTNFSWLLKMAWRDSRRNRARLLLFISSIIVGIAALVAINSFSENLQKDINGEAKNLLGADLQIESNRPAADSIQSFFDTLGGERASSVNFISMVFFPESEGTRLADIRALEGAYPFYGTMLTEPASAFQTFQSGKKALVDKTLMYSYNLQPGDSIKVGEVVFEIEGQLNSTPGRAGVASTVAPVVIIPQQYLGATELIQLGSRVDYNYYVKYSPETDVEALVETHKERFRELGLRFDTVEERKEDIGEAFSNMATFLNLVGFIALLLGCIGVASSVHIYIKDKLSTVAVLRCLGASGRQAFLIYLLQILFMGLLGAIIGAILGSLLQLILPMILSDFLPINNVSKDLSLTAVFQGIITGLGIAVLFALIPLLSIRRISPLRSLRASFDGDTVGRDYLQWGVYGLIFLFVLGFSFVQTGGAREAIFFPISIVVAFLILAGMARLVMVLVKRFFPSNWSYVWRQSLANLFRPNNQTLILIVSIGLGTGLISTLFFTQDLLLEQVKLSGSGDRPNMILWDIQSPQKEAVTQLSQDYDLPLMQQVPIVTMSLDNINGITKSMNLKDTARENGIRRWVFNREYRVTYRDTLIDSETIKDGEWHGDKPDDGKVYVSIADNIADDMNAEVGTKLVFNVQGTLVETEVSSIREVDFNRVQTNFMVVFPNDVLEQAPQFHVIVSKVESVEQSARFQQALVKQFPNVSVIDLTQILQTVDDVLGKVSFVIRFMALFSILTGLLVLISSVILSKYQRIQESVLLRTIGASRSQILWINALEYLLLGSLATLTGILLSIVGSWLLAKFSFQIPFSINAIPPIVTFITITGLTILIGLFNSREIVSKPPLEVLRKEV